MDIDKNNNGKSVVIFNSQELKKGKSNQAEIKKIDSPNIFLKKKSITDIKRIKFVSNDTGKTRHFPPAAQE